MSERLSRWGIVATIKAPAIDILNWAAYHLEAGAHRLCIYLDAPCPDAQDLLEQHSKIRVFECDDASWAHRRKKGRPDNHQSRQTLNATRAYRRQTSGLDWLIHMDVDEFLWSDAPLSHILADLPETAFCARAYPIEALAGGDGTAFKARIPRGPETGATTARLYPTFGEHVLGGFLSHLQGKIFVRPRQEAVQYRIHNVFRDGQENPEQVILPQVDLCHCHARDWDSWIGHFRYRLEKGSYRPELKPLRPRSKGGLNLHELLTMIESDHGLDGLRSFFEEICADTPDLRARLAQEDLLRLRDLQLEAKRKKVFPDFG